jgi:hypothetical protein
MPSEPITTDWRMSFIDRYGQRVVLNNPACCGMCRKCLVAVTGKCAYGGPFTTEGIVVCLEKQQEVD